MKETNLDKELLNRYHTDNNNGFKAIVKTFQERVYWQIRRYTKNHEDTEDIMQTVFIKVWKGLANFRSEANLYTWIYRIAFNETHSFLAKKQKNKHINQDPPLFEKPVTIGERDYSPDEIESLLKQALNTLPEKQLLVFNLRYFDELKFSEIAKLTGTTEGGLKASYHLAVKKIESFLTEH
jgi:RNA polymerase sigma factor (sigma-70 family)